MQTSRRYTEKQWGEIDTPNGFATVSLHSDAEHIKDPPDPDKCPYNMIPTSPTDINTIVSNTNLLKVTHISKDKLN